MNWTDYIGKVTQGDCIQLIKNIPDKSIDMIITDPPYGFDKFKGDEKNYLDIISPSFIDYSRILKDDGCAFLFSNTRDIIKIANLMPLNFRRLFWMYKPADCTFPFDDGWLLTSEAILYFSKNGKPNLREVHPYEHDCYTHYRVGKEGVEGHPTVKPLQVIQKIANRSQENAIILDPFLGSGTTALACERLNRRWIGFEISSTYCEIARARIDKERNQLKLNLGG